MFLIFDEPSDSDGLYNAVVGMTEKSLSMKRSKCQTGLNEINLRLDYQQKQKRKVKVHVQNERL